MNKGDKHIRPVNEKLAADLLEAGKQEFLEKGFQGASMRGIASRLSVTTGALYRYYTDKESLFDVLVEESARRDTVLSRRDLQTSRWMPRSRHFRRCLTKAIPGWWNTFMIILMHLS